MDCPRCSAILFESEMVCPECGLVGNGRSLQHWSNLTFLLTEITRWEIPDKYLDPLRQTYTAQLNTVEITLGLRQPLPTAAEAQALRHRHWQLAMLNFALGDWQAKGWLDAAISDPMRAQLMQEMVVVNGRLHLSPVAPQVTAVAYTLARLEEKRIILATAQELHAAGHLSADGWRVIAADLQSAIEHLEVQAGLRQAAPVAPSVRHEEAVGEPIEKVPKTPRWQRPSFTWDRVWESLLSERTLHAVLFMGVVLLLASGVSWVAWNWDTFPPLAQVGFLGSFTAGFYLLGGFVRTRMKLTGSGEALIAVASLLIPLDVYAFYLSGGFPPGSGPTVWLVASVVCLGVYVATAVLLQAPFFGYLVAVAVGSLILAGLNLVGVGMVWWGTAVTLIALLLAAASEILPYAPARWRFLAAPFAHIALLVTAPVLAVPLVWGFVVGGAPAFYQALSASWWLGGLTFTLMARRYRLQTFVWVAALTFPVAMYLAQRTWFFLWRVDEAWYALGWLLLTPVYFGAAALITYRAAKDEFGRVAGQTAGRVGALLMVLAALWSLQDAGAATAVHLLLAVGAALAAWVTYRGRLFWGMALFTAVATTAWQAGHGAAPAELALPWALLAVLHVCAALALRGRLGERPAAFLAPLYGAGVALAGLAVLPPLVVFDQPLLVYALGNWIVLNGWLAMLTHQTTPGLVELLAARPFTHRRLTGLRPAFFHWCAALPLPIWLWLSGTIENAPSPGLGLFMAALAWGLMALAVWLRRRRWDYERPWHIASLFAITLAFGLAFIGLNAAKGAPVMWATAVYFLAALWVFHSSRYFYMAGWLLPLAWLFSQDVLNLDWHVVNATLGFFPLAYVLLGVGLEKGRGRERPFTRPMFRMALLMSLPILLANGAQAVVDWEQNALAWAAIAPGLIGLAAATYAWLTGDVFWAHVGVWLVTLAGGLVVKTYSHGSGRSAALVALMAIIYVLGERGLYSLALRPHQAGWLDYRAAWRVFRRPLLLAGWVLSLAAIGAAIGRNLILLGGGPAREWWAILALALITGLYALSARLFRQARFVWLAAALSIAPWTVLVARLWGDVSEVGTWFGAAWVFWGLALLGVGALLAWRLGLGRWSWPPMVVAHVLVPASLLVVVLDTAVASASFGLAIAFYLSAAAIDRWGRAKGEAAAARFLFPLAALLPVWSAYLCLWLFPTATAATLALVVWAWALPLLAAGRWMARWEPEYRWPFYLAASGVALAALGLAMGNWWVLTAVLLLNAGLSGLCVWLFREPLWWYPAGALLPTASWTLLAQIGRADVRHYGWALLALAAIYLGGAWLLRRVGLRRYETPLIAMTFVLVAVGLPPCSMERLGALVGYSAAVMILTAAAVWLQRPFVFSLAVMLASVPYWVGWTWLGVLDANAGLAAWPAILVALALAWYLDMRWHPGLPAFPWAKVRGWPRAVWARWTGWWALSLYGLAWLTIMLSALLAVVEPWRWLAVLVGGTAVFSWWTIRFRLRLWLLWAGLWAQLTAVALIRLIGWADSGGQWALAFMPVVWLTGLAAFLVEEGRLEERVLAQANGRWSLSLAGWALPFYLLLAGDVFVTQLAALDLVWQSALVTLLNAALVGILATHWRVRGLAYLAAAWGVGALGVWLVWLAPQPTVAPQAVAVLALVYGAVGYGLRRWQRDELGAPGWVMVWERPFIHSGWLLSALALVLALLAGNPLLTRLPMVLFGGGLSAPAVLAAQMFIRVLALLGLLYLTAAVVERRHRLSYLALLLLFAAWSLWLLAIQGARELQLFAAPAGFYLLLMGWLEWARGSRALARWLDRLGIVVLFGSALWQSFGAAGEWYALLMGVEGLLLVWLGSVRRLRRLLYAGVAGVITAVAGQLIEPLLALNTLVLLLLGAALVGLGIALERRLDKVRDLSHELRLKLENWE